MEVHSRKYLSEQVLAEDKTVTYRTLSRALKANVNLAKQLLYDFHSWQNGKRPGSVHATYMIYGTKTVDQVNGHSQHDGDIEMASSPPDATPVVEEVPLATLSLVAEESLNKVLSQYQSVTSVHIYSLGPQPVKDVQLLAEVSRPILDLPAEGDSANPTKFLGPIRNPFVRRRDRCGPAALATAPAPARKQADTKQANKRAATNNLAPALDHKDATEGKEKPASKSSSKESTPVSSGDKKTASKRGPPGGIMRSFAKAASKTTKAVDTPSATQTTFEDSSAQALSDDGEDDFTAEPESNKESEATRKTRKDRQEELKRMMEESSEDEPEKEDTPMEEPEEELPPPEQEQKEEAEPAEVVSSTGDGRRRGKRRVMKKKTVMDDQGYLVTVQEPGWESFSEDEPAQPAKKKVEAASQPAKAKKPAPKGQGSIMSFFGKK